jgi:hypothetical protein
MQLELHQRRAALRQNFGDAVKGRVTRFEQRGLNYAEAITGDSAEAPGYR